MAHIQTASGFEADINEAQIDDYRLMKAIRAAQKEPVAIVDVVSFVLGEDEDRLIDHLIQATGKAAVEDINREITEIFGQLSASKKK